MDITYLAVVCCCTCGGFDFKFIWESCTFEGPPFYVPPPFVETVG